MTRPDVPDWIRSYTPPPGWTNVFSLVPSNEHLYGTETLFGDWDGQTLLLAKDGAPTPVIRSLRDKGERRPWRHAQRELGDPGGWKTNEWLASMASTIPGGKLYGSATANLLYDDPGWSRSLPGFYTPGPLQEYLKRVLTWVLTSMPNAARVACLGQEAWYLTSIVLGQPHVAGQFASHRDSHRPIVGNCGGKFITAHPLFHPAARVLDDSTRAGWQAMTAVANANGGAKRIHPILKAAPLASKPVEAKRAASDWNEATFKRNPVVKQIRDSPIRAEMVSILQRAGASGVPWRAFGGLNWRTECNAELVYKAMNLVASRNGYRLQYKGNKTCPDRWRIAQ